MTSPSLATAFLQSVPIPIPASRRSTAVSDQSPPKLPVISSPQKQDRAIVGIFREIAAKYALFLDFQDGNWVASFTNPDTGVTKRVIGYSFGINDSSAKQCCDDKAASSGLLTAHRVPHIEHTLFLRAGIVGYDDIGKGVSQMFEHAQEISKNGNTGIDVVIKPNDGSNGIGVTRVRTKDQLEAAAMNLFKTSTRLCISPYYEIEGEYRVIVLNGYPRFAFKKVRPHLIGDGESSVKILLSNYIASQKSSQLQKMGEVVFKDLALDDIPAKGAIINLKWKHNLCSGAEAEIIYDLETIQPITDLAIRATKVVGITFCSADVAVMPDGSLRIVELNAGVMTENLLKQYKDNSYVQQKVRAIYERAVCQMLEIEYQAEPPFSLPDARLSSLEMRAFSQSSMKIARFPEVQLTNSSPLGGSEPRPPALDPIALSVPSSLRRSSSFDNSPPLSSSPSSPQRIPSEDETDESDSAPPPPSATAPFIDFKTRLPTPPPLPPSPSLLTLSLHGRMSPLEKRP